MIGRFDVAISKLNLFEDCIEHIHLYQPFSKKIWVDIKEV